MGPATPSPSGSIFICYRREESAYPAAWLYDRLAHRFGPHRVFKDVDSVDLGDDFAEVIAGAVGACDVLLALIGDDWATMTDDAGNRRLDDPADFIRLEVEAALARGVRVIPILVDGASLPTADQLPTSLSGIVRRQALELDATRFDADTARLLRTLDRTLQELADGRAAAAVGDAGQDTEPRAGTEPGAPEPVSVAPVHPTADERGPTRVVLAAAAVVVAIAVVILVVALAVRSDDGADTSADQATVADSEASPDADDSGVAAPATGRGIQFDPTPVTNEEHGLRLENLDAVSVRDPAPPRLNDTVTVSFSLTNVGDDPVDFQYTFVGVRHDGQNEDTEDGNAGRVLLPGESLQAVGLQILSEPGVWEFFPCYQLANDDFCPDRWHVFFVPTDAG